MKHLHITKVVLFMVALWATTTLSANNTLNLGAGITMSIPQEFKQQANKHYLCFAKKDNSTWIGIKISPTNNLEKAADASFNFNEYVLKKKESGGRFFINTDYVRQYYAELNNKTGQKYVTHAGETPYFTYIILMAYTNPQDLEYLDQITDSVDISGLNYEKRMQMYCENGIVFIIALFILVFFLNVGIHKPTTEFIIWAAATLLLAAFAWGDWAVILSLAIIMAIPTIWGRQYEDPGEMFLAILQGFLDQL